ncbi:hydroxypyruvate isomerase family protein [Geodermatophilus sp. SYSU D00758]
MRWAVNTSILFGDLPRERRPHAAREAGFTAVESWWPFDSATPGDREVEGFVRAVEDAGVRLVALNFPAGAMADGDRGLLSVPGREVEWRDAVAATVGIGERLGVRLFNALYGNRAGDTDPAVQDALAVEHLTLATRAAARIGGTVLLEPLNAAPRYPLRTAEDALAVADRVAAETGAPGPGLLLDLYHLAVNGEDLDRVVAVHGPRAAHVQVADAPGRGAPGYRAARRRTPRAPVGRCRLRRLGGPRVRARDGGPVRLVAEGAPHGGLTGAAPEPVGRDRYARQVRTARGGPSRRADVTLVVPPGRDVTGRPGPLVPVTPAGPRRTSHEATARPRHLDRRPRRCVHLVRRQRDRPRVLAGPVRRLGRVRRPGVLLRRGGSTPRAAGSAAWAGPSPAR